MAETTPTGVKVIAIFTGFYGLLWIATGLLWILYDGTSIWAVVSPPIGIAILAVSVGLWRLDRRAWGLTIAVYGLSLVWTLLQIAAGAWDRVAALVVGLLVVWYLVDNDDYFGREQPENT